MKRFISLLFILLIISSGCSQSDEPITDNSQTPYFPPIDSEVWETITPESLNWNTALLPELKNYLNEKNTDAFIILKNGRIVVEYYFNDFSLASPHAWNSAGKTLTSVVVGIAEQNGYLNINDSTSEYLGEGWTVMTPEQERAIAIKNQLTMTSGGDYTVPDTTCTDPECLKYLNEPDTFWFYHNAFYSLLQRVLDRAIPEGFDSYFDSKLKNPIGMSGTWLQFGYNRIFFSNARSMARFGILNLNRGKWNGTQLLNKNYFQKMTESSQELNKAYGFLWWLNGKESYHLPQSTRQFQGKLIPNAPDDLIAALGKNDQKLYIVPSQGIIVVRMGDNAGNSVPGPSGFDNELWGKLSQILNY
ncbi:class C beta-lactamase-related serine hydrolase [Aequorivita sp. H23M31]|uniref:Class C beta-lactamase-related serine hydrolase n=1 Tax=Aequorivita ciconiae TaxID=2494375 RepID=A0A410G6G8_9FLAO|nr:serine hydrolase [Aequorivita sp. H23M31]QAA82888.1 class C beta-lactamase-related serine hydrolase [Aequorivita sp. H23M31]